MIAFVEPVFLVLSSVPAFVNEAAAPAQGATIPGEKPRSLARSLHSA
jgi:hypothetical protein